MWVFGSSVYYIENGQQNQVQWKGLILGEPPTSSWCPLYQVSRLCLITVLITGTSRVRANKKWFITATENLTLLINMMNRTGSFKYTVRTIANYIILFVDYSLFVFAYNLANNFRKVYRGLILLLLAPYIRFQASIEPHESLVKITNSLIKEYFFRGRGDYFSHTDIFRQLKLEIALAIPASNEEKY